MIVHTNSRFLHLNIFYFNLILKRLISVRSISVCFSFVFCICQHVSLVTIFYFSFLRENIVSLFRFVFRSATNYFSYLPSWVLKYDTHKIILNAVVAIYCSCLLRRVLKNVSKNIYFYLNNLGRVG